MKDLLKSTLTMIRDDIEYEAEEPNADVWQTYAESIANGGDCEDMVLAMYEVLLLKGYPEDSMSFIAGKLTRSGEMHMVLEVGEWGEYILDSNQRKPINSDKYYRRYMERTYSVNSDGLSINGKFLCTRDQLPKWQRYIGAKE